MIITSLLGRQTARVWETSSRPFLQVCTTSIRNATCWFHQTTFGALPSRAVDVPYQSSAGELGKTERNCKRRGSTSFEVPPPSFAARFVESCPSYLRPYLRLTRVDRPIGSWLLFWPGAWSIALATSPGHLPDIKLLCLFGVGSFLMRGAGCIVNDLWDSDIDGKVARTADRPLASGQISKKVAFSLVGVHGLAALPILLSLNTYSTNWYYLYWRYAYQPLFRCGSIWLGLASIVPALMYPYMKRVTNWPQAFLGIVFSWGALLGYSADKDDDAVLGLKSTSLYFGDKTKPWLSVFLLAMTSNLVVSGIQSEQTWPYHVAAMSCATLLGKQLWTVNLDNRQECGQMFRDSWWVGILLFAGIIVSTLLKHPREEKTDVLHTTQVGSNL